MANQHFLAGLYKVMVTRLDSTNGYSMGNAIDPDNVAAGTGLSAYVVEHPIEFSPAEVTRAEAEEMGGNKARGKMDLGTQSFSSVTMSFSSNDADFDAIVTNALVDSTTWPGWEVSSPHVLNDDPPQVAIWCVGGAQGRNPDKTKPDRYGKNRIRTVIGVGTITPIKTGGTTSGGTNPSPSRYTFVPTLISTLPNGVAWSSFSLNGQTETISPDLFTDNQFHVFTYVAEAADISFTLPYLPLHSDVTDGKAKNIITKNGTLTAPTSIDTATGIVTIPSATANDVWQIWYPTSFVASS